MMRIKRYLCLFLAVWFICQLSLVLAEEAAPVVPKGSGEASAEKRDDVPAAGAADGRHDGRRDDGAAGDANGAETQQAL